jgi:small subunit ribosomal protein S10
MPQAARIKLTSTNLTTLEGVCNEIKGQGTNTYDKYEMRIHRRVIDVGADDRAIRQLMRLKIPDDVYIEVSLTQ